MISFQDISDYTAYIFYLIDEYCEFSLDNYIT